MSYNMNSQQEIYGEMRKHVVQTTKENVLNKMNVSKQRLFKTLGIKNGFEYKKNNRALLKKIQEWLRVNWISINKGDQN